MNIAALEQKLNDRGFIIHTVEGQAVYILLADVYAFLNYGRRYIEDQLPEWNKWAKDIIDVHEVSRKDHLLFTKRAVYNLASGSNAQTPTIDSSMYLLIPHYVALQMLREHRKHSAVANLCNDMEQALEEPIRVDNRDSRHRPADGGFLSTMVHPSRMRRRRSLEPIAMPDPMDQNGIIELIKPVLKTVSGVKMMVYPSDSGSVLAAADVRSYLNSVGKEDTALPPVVKTKDGAEFIHLADAVNIISNVSPKP